MTGTFTPADGAGGANAGDPAGVARWVVAVARRFEGWWRIALSRIAVASAAGQENATYRHHLQCYVSSVDA